MALSGNFSNYPVSGFGLYCTWSASQNLIGNYSDVTLNVYLKYYDLYVGDRSDSTISINGTSETYTVAAISESSTSTHSKLLKSKTVRVYHDTGGIKRGVTLSASWRFSGVYSGVSIGTITASTSIDLNSLDRTAPSVSCSVSGITATGFKIIATSSAIADIWQYSVNGGTAWQQFSTTAGTSASITLTSLTANTNYTVKVRARKKSNQVYGTSSSISAKTLGGAILNSCNNMTADASTVSLTLNATVYNSSYSNYITIKNGATTLLTLGARTWSTGTANRTITLTSAERTTLLTAMANVMSFTATISLVTKNGNTQIGGASSCTCKISTTRTYSGPDMGAFSYKDINVTTSTITGNNQILIQGYSKLQITCGTAVAKNGASIVSYTASCNGVTVSNTTGVSLDVGTISASGNLSVVVSATDSRGYTVSNTKTISVLAYSKPRISSLTLRRTNDIESEMQLKFNGSISPITVGGVQKNSLQYVRYRYKQTNATSYSGYYSILPSVTISGSSFSFTNLQLCNLSTTLSYDFHIQIFDRLLGQSESGLDLYYVIPQGTPLIALRKKKVGINTPDPKYALHVVGDTRVDGRILMNGFNIMGLVMEAIPDSTNLNSLTAPGIYFRRNAADMDLNYPCTLWGMLEVFSCSPNVVIQRYTKRDPPYTMYIRSRVNSTWNAWTQK